jgi:hypothetical protein
LKRLILKRQTARRARRAVCLEFGYFTREGLPTRG